MARLIAPNGVEVDASELDEPILLSAGYRRADAPKKQAGQPRKRTARKKKEQ